MTAGRKKQTVIRPIQSAAVMDAFVPAAMSFNQPVETPICPTSPQVPMPEETGVPFICSRNRQVAMGPVMADATMGGIQIFGFFTMLPI